MTIPARIKDDLPFLTSLRRDLHAHPELGFEEERTSGIVAKLLEEAGIKVHRGLGTTGVVGTLQVGNGTRSIGLRADMDALAMVLENNRFHEIFGEMSGNVYMQPSLGRLLIDHARIGHTFFRPRNEDMRRRLRLAVEHHDSFIAALGAHDEDAVVDLVFEHWELSRENMEMFIAPQGLKADAFVGGPATQLLEKSS